MASQPKWDRCFDTAKIARFRQRIPAAYAAIEDVAQRRVVGWPSPIACMTAAEIRDGQRTGAGHGLYLHGPPRRIKINASMSASQIFANFVHENLHYALPALPERTIDDLTASVLEHLGPRATRVANMSARQVRKVLRKAGCEELRQKGSHVQIQCPDGRQTTVPAHGSKDIKKGTLKGIERSLGIDIDGDGRPAPTPREQRLANRLSNGG